jgi:hypothetical protein
VNLQEYQNQLQKLLTGKRLPTLIYVFRSANCSFGKELDLLVAQAAAIYGADERHNVIKFRTNELKLSFLSYPNFVDAPHPELRHAITVDLVAGRSRSIDYARNLNPPILHRKENFVPLDHPRRAEFERLTKAEEAAGLYEDTTTIGFKLNWEKLLVQKGLKIEGHMLIPVKATESEDLCPTVVERHKTALARYDLSKPIKTLMEHGLLKTGFTIFDYGCGQGGDVKGLRSLGYEAEGWDPVHRPQSDKREADIVNFGYVLNVIEDPAERLEALVEAHRYARRLLVVSALIRETVATERAEAFADGVLTKRGTFQKFYEQQELQQFLEDALETTVVPAGLGMFYAFRDPIDQQDFLAARTRRIVDWTQITARLGLGGPPENRWQALYKQNQDLLDAFGRLTIELGRFPQPTEFDRLDKVRQTLGSEKRALRAFVQGTNTGLKWEETAARFGIGQPRKAKWESLYEKNPELFDSFWNRTLELGRTPSAEEFSGFNELFALVGSPKRALSLLLRRGGAEALAQAAENRRNDLLVYLAMSNLRKRVPFGHLSPVLRLDIRTFYGNHRRALEKGLELLYAAGDHGEIEVACDALNIGWQDEQALYFHLSVLDRLPPVLRAYVGCATTLFGDVTQADLVKLHKESGKVTFLLYDDFENKPLPELQHRIKVNLRTRWVQAFDHSADGQLLYFKERFVGENYPGRAKMETLSVRLRNLGIPEGVATGPTKEEFTCLLKKHGLKEIKDVLAAPEMGGPALGNGTVEKLNTHI